MEEGQSTDGPRDKFEDGEEKKTNKVIDVEEVKKDKGGDPSVPPGKPKEKTPLTLAMSKAFKEKARFEDALAKAISLNEAVGHDPSWSWANNPSMLEKFRTAKRLLHDNLSKFARQILNGDQRSLKAAYGDAELEIECKSFVKEVEKNVEDVHNQMQILRTMHDAREAQLTKTTCADGKTAKPKKAAKNKK